MHLPLAVPALRRLSVAAGLSLGLSVVNLGSSLPTGIAHSQATSTSAAILAVAGRQAAWLNLEAPRNRPVSKLPNTNNALELTAQPDGSHVVVSTGAPFPGGGARGADLLNLDLATGQTSPLLTRSTATESLNSPSWWSDRSTLLFERQDLVGQTTGAPGQEVPRYPSRIERVQADGSGRDVLIPQGRQPSASPDGTRLVFARTTNTGAALLIWSQADGSITTIVPEGRFADVAYPQFSPGSDQIAFVAPQSGINGQLPESPWQAWLGPAVAYAHGIPWDPWVVNTDGSNLHRVAETGADEPSVAWSPDQSQLFVYSGTGSFVMTASGSEVTPLSYVTGYGPVVWLAAEP